MRNVGSRRKRKTRGQDRAKGVRCYQAFLKEKKGDGESARWFVEGNQTTENATNKGTIALVGNVSQTSKRRKRKPRCTTVQTGFPKKNGTQPKARKRAQTLGPHAVEEKKNKMSVRNMDPRPPKGGGVTKVKKKGRGKQVACQSPAHEIFLCGKGQRVGGGEKKGKTRA